MTSEYSKIKYNIVFARNDQESIVIDWGNTPDWWESNREFIADSERVLFIPKQEYNGVMPVVSVMLGGNKKPIVFTRNFGSNKKGFGKEIRVHAIGWQENIDGNSFKSVTWIYPNGEIEVNDGDGPSFAWAYLARL